MSRRRRPEAVRGRRCPRANLAERRLNSIERGEVCGGLIGGDLVRPTTVAFQHICLDADKAGSLVTHRGGFSGLPILDPRRGRVSMWEWLNPTIPEANQPPRGGHRRQKRQPPQTLSAQLWEISCLRLALHCKRSGDA